jgi:23S rRNA pseudouridine1911/1915/1917 synthase
VLRFVASEAEAGRRLDLALAELAAVPRAQAQRWIEAGRVRVAGAPARASHRLAAGEAIEADPPEPVALSLEPEPIPLAILYEDADLVVVDKPAGVVVHPAPGHPRGTLVNALLHHCRDLAGIGGVLRPGIVHRLDQGTSGVLVAAKHDTAHVALAAQFREHSVERVYLAIVHGVPGAAGGRVERAIGRHPVDRKRMSVRTGSGRESVTDWRVARRFPASEATLLEVRPATGRTHQIRVHLSSVGLPIAGDPVYGRARHEASARLGLSRPALHAAVLGFEHPRSGAWLRFEAPPPADFAAALAALAEREGAAKPSGSSGVSPPEHRA